MNSLTLGFFYVVGLTWGLCEVCIMASNGNWTPLTLYLIGFTLLFAIVGCWPMSDKSVNTLGSIFAIILGVSLLMIAVASFVGRPEGAGFLWPILKTLIAGMFVVYGLVGFMTRGSESSHSH